MQWACFSCDLAFRIHEIWWRHSFCNYWYTRLMLLLLYWLIMTRPPPPHTTHPTATTIRFGNKIKKCNGWNPFWWFMCCAILVNLSQVNATELHGTEHPSRCHKATSRYLSKCWPRSLSPYGVTRPQWVNLFLITYTWLWSDLFCCDYTMEFLHIIYTWLWFFFIIIIS